MTPVITVGVLALQGAFLEHIQLLGEAVRQIRPEIEQHWEISILEVRTAEELQRCEALIIPGGESTTVSLVAARSNLLEPLRDFVKYTSLLLKSVACADQRRTGFFGDQPGELVLD